MYDDFTPGKPLRIYDKDGNWKDFNNEKLVGDKLNRFYGWKCGAGTLSMHVGFYGEVTVGSYSCKWGVKRKETLKEIIARSHGKELIHKDNEHGVTILGNVFDDFELPTDWITCEQKECICGADLLIPKAKNEEYLKLLKKTENIPPDFSARTEKDFDIVAMEKSFLPGVKKQIYWDLSLACNYSCSYCWQHDKKEKYNTYEKLMEATHKIEDKFIKGERCNFAISGGEPTFQPGYIDWIKYLFNKKYYVSSHSNGSNKLEVYKKLIHYSDLNISVHFEFYKSERLLKVLDAITQEKVKYNNMKVGHLEVKLMFRPGIRRELLWFERHIRKIPNFTEYCTLSIVPLVGPYKYTPDESYFKEKEYDIIERYYTDQDKELFGDRN
jgi:organic radical activating enzyme